MSEKTPIKKRYSAFFNQDFPRDLILVGVWLAAGIIAIYLPVLNQNPVRVVLALPVLLFISGYSLISALFSKEGDIDLITRITLSIGVSVAIVLLICLGLNFTPWGIRLDPIVISLTLFSMVLIFVAHYTRTILPAQERFRMPFSAIAGTNREEILPSGGGRIDRLLSAVLILGILITLIITAYVITVPREG